MDEKTLAEFQAKMTETFDTVLEQKLKGVIGEMAAFEVKKVAETLRVERALYGADRTGLTEEKKVDFVKAVKAVAFGRTKANEAFVEEQDSRGGYLVDSEVANAIVRIAASVGLVMSQASRWPMKTDELQIPAYTGSILEGEYLGFDAAGSVTGLTFKAANLIVKKWQLAFVVGNDLLSDATPALADWLLALAGEALANAVDKQGLVGTAPFVGVLNHPDVTVQTMASGKDTFAEFDLAEASDGIGSLEESVLDGAGFVLHRTLWAKVRVAKDSSTYILPQAGAPTSALLSNFVGRIGGARPVGEILGYPVFSNRHMPANSATAVSTKFGFFGNMSALAYGDRGDMRVAQHASGSFGGKEVALADQTGLVYKHRHAIVVTLPAAFTVFKTAAS